MPADAASRSMLAWGEGGCMSSMRRRAGVPRIARARLTCLLFHDCSLPPQQSLAMLLVAQLQACLRGAAWAACAGRQMSAPPLLPPQRDPLSARRMAWSSFKCTGWVHCSGEPKSLVAFQMTQGGCTA
eukprot:1159323-Pelagomonas_calceolata.AAC.2